MKTQIHVECGPYLLDGDQKDVLEKMGFTGIRQRKTFDEYYQPREEFLWVEIDIAGLILITDMFDISIEWYGVSLKPRG